MKTIELDLAELKSMQQIRWLDFKLKFNQIMKITIAKIIGNNIKLINIFENS